MLYLRNQCIQLVIWNYLFTVDTEDSQNLHEDEAQDREHRF